MIVNSVENIIEEISGNSDKRIVSIDGWTGAGKTTLLSQVGVQLNFYTISIDSFLEKNKGLYLEAVNYSELKDLLKQKIDSGKNILIEGVCIQKILDQIDFKSDLSIYIKEMGILDWTKENYVDESKTPEQIFKEDDEANKIDVMTGKEKAIAEKETTEKREGLFYDVVRYHYEYKPHVDSDIIFERPYKEENE